MLAHRTITISKGSIFTLVLSTTCQDVLYSCSVVSLRFGIFKDFIIPLTIRIRAEDITISDIVNHVITKVEFVVFSRDSRMIKDNVVRRLEVITTFLGSDIERTPIRIGGSTIIVQVIWRFFRKLGCFTIFSEFGKVEFYHSTWNLRISRRTMLRIRRSQTQSFLILLLAIVLNLDSLSIFLGSQRNHGQELPTSFLDFISVLVNRRNTIFDVLTTITRLDINNTKVTSFSIKQTIRQESDFVSIITPEDILNRSS